MPTRLLLGDCWLPGFEQRGFDSARDVAGPSTPEKVGRLFVVHIFLGFQVYTQYLHWGPKYVKTTFFGLLGSLGYGRCWKA